MEEENRLKDDTIKNLNEQIATNKDNHMKEQSKWVLDLKSSKEDFWRLVFHSTTETEQRRCLGEYEKLSEEKTKEKYDSFLKEGVVTKEDINPILPEGGQKRLRSVFGA